MSYIEERGLIAKIKMGIPSWCWILPSRTEGPGVCSPSKPLPWAPLSSFLAMQFLCPISHYLIAKVVNSTSCGPILSKGAIASL